MSDAQPLHEPFDVSVEQACIGSLLLDSGLIPQAMGILDADQFYDPLHQRIYAQIIVWAIEGDRAITPLTVHAAMKADPGLIELGGVRYLAGLVAAAPAHPPIRSFALTIRELSQRRVALQALDEARVALTGSPTAVRDALKTVMVVADEAERMAASERFQSTYEAGMDLLREAEKASAGGRIRAVTTGLQKLKEETGDFQGADFIVVAGESGAGKSALMGGISLRAAMAGYPVIFFSQEMKRKKLVARFVADIDFDTADHALWYSKFRTGGFTAGEFARAGSAISFLDSIPWLEIHDDDGLTMAQMYARARAFQAKWRYNKQIRGLQKCSDNEEPIGLVINDYIQITDPGKGAAGRNREQEVRDIARGHKSMAKRLDWAVMAGSQINSDKNASPDKRPNAGDVRESKAIRHEADIILMPYREAVAILAAKPAAPPGDPAWNSWNGLYQAAKYRFEIIGAKNRDGRQFNLELWGDMAANAVRDRKPTKPQAQQEADNLLRALNG